MIIIIIVKILKALFWKVLNINLSKAHIWIGFTNTRSHRPVLFAFNAAPRLTLWHKLDKFKQRRHIPECLRVHVKQSLIETEIIF